ncbi:hypothetical protein, partial [Serratia marcescens]
PLENTMLHQALGPPPICSQFFHTLTVLRSCHVTFILLLANKTIFYPPHCLSPTTNASLIPAVSEPESHFK